MEELVPDDVKLVFKDVLERAGDCYTCIEFEDAGFHVSKDEIPETHWGIKTHGDIYALPVVDRIDLYLKKVDWKDRESLKKLMLVINHYMSIFFGPGCNPGWVKDEIRNRLWENGLVFKEGRLQKK